MSYNVGKVINYDGHYGEIVSKLGKHIFLSKDIDPEHNIEIGTIVAFRDERINKESRAFFVKELDKVLNSEREDVQNARLIKQIDNKEINHI